MDQPTEQELEQMYLETLKDRAANDPFLKWLDTFVRQLEKANGPSTV